MSTRPAAQAVEQAQAQSTCSTPQAEAAEPQETVVTAKGQAANGVPVESTKRRCQ